MNVGDFRILSASAGTGKTYRLTKAYLLVLLKDNSPQNFRNLLAITFTNKAVAEMKQRILNTLFSFASHTPLAPKDVLFEEFTEELNLTPLKLAERSKNTLKNLLHNYAFFDVSTIDAFNHRLIRTFAKDLNISQNFEVELDTEYVLSIAINHLLEKAGRDKELTEILIDFALEKIDDGKSWNIAYDLSETGKLIFNENHYDHLKSISKKPLDSFLKLKESLNAQIKDLEHVIQRASKDSLELISENNLEQTDFTRGSFPKFLEEALKNPKGLDFSAKWKENFENNPLYNKSLDSEKKAVIDAILPTLTKYFLLIKKSFQKASLLSRFEKNIVPLALISSIQKEINTQKEENHFLTINEFNELISREIKKQPVPYIYERMGERYRHYFIDEFQDTSVLQWENLIPLIGHALESSNDLGQKGSLFLVGDIKQAIYRWRGGEPTQFMQLMGGEQNPFTILSEVEQLPKNWRSYDQIINFNNSFFSYISNQLQNQTHKQLYKTGNQQLPNDKAGGIVKISFTPNKNEGEVHPHISKTLNSITEIKGYGHSYSDICILVRSKKNEKLIAEHLSQNEIPVISAEGLSLQNNEVVGFLISFLEFIINPNEKEYVFSVLEFLFRDAEKSYDYILKHWGNLSSYLIEAYEIDVAKLRFKGTMNLVETIVDKLDLVSESSAYIVAFLDAISEYEKTDSGGIHGFLDYWYLKKSKLVLPMPENIDAVKIMTIHKSKGLEFPFVIFPFADDVINDSRKQNDIWISLEPNEFEGFDELMLTNNKLLSNYSDEAARAYEEENEKKILDDFNILYVALTRAVKGLYIISSPSKQNSNQISYATLLCDYLQNQNCSVDDLGEIGFGTLESNSDSSKEVEVKTIPYIYSRFSFDDFEIAEQQNIYNRPIDETINHGNLVHSVLAEIYCEEDIPHSIEKHVKLGLFEEREAKGIENLILKVVHHDNLKRFFAKNIDAKNESEILMHNGSTIRPDKLVFIDGKISIIDYKTGGRSESHKHQVEQYADVLAKMGFEVEEKILAYINKDINTLVV